MSNMWLISVKLDSGKATKAEMEGEMGDEREEMTGFHFQKKNID